MDTSGMVCAYADIPAVPDSVAFFADDRLYALKSDDFWSYSRTTQERLIEDVAGINLNGTGKSLSLPRNLRFAKRQDPPLTAG